MNVPREQIVRKVRAWVAAADDDLRMAVYGVEMPAPTPNRLIAFHAQQCVEKYLKAYLVHRGTDFPYTHNISFLLELCPKDRVWPAWMAKAEELTPFATTTRYPSEDETVTTAEADEAVALATRVRDAVRDALIAEGISFDPA